MATKPSLIHPIPKHAPEGQGPASESFLLARWLPLLLLVACLPPSLVWL